MAFARDSGELQSLSSVDMKLIALAHTLELRAHGPEHLRRRPPAPRVHSKGSVHARRAKHFGAGMLCTGQTSVVHANFIRVACS